MIDVYEIIDIDNCEQIGDWSSNIHEGAPLSYEKVGVGAYELGSFFGNEIASLYVNKEEKTYYLLSCISEPIGDYAYHNTYLWYKSMPENYEKITGRIN